MVVADLRLDSPWNQRSACTHPGSRDTTGQAFRAVLTAAEPHTWNSSGGGLRFSSVRHEEAMLENSNGVGRGADSAACYLHSFGSRTRR